MHFLWVHRNTTTNKYCEEWCQGPSTTPRTTPFLSQIKKKTNLLRLRLYMKCCAVQCPLCILLSSVLLYASTDRVPLRKEREYGRKRRSVFILCDVSFWIFVQTSLSKKCLCLRFICTHGVSGGRLVPRAVSKKKSSLIISKKIKKIYKLLSMLSPFFSPPRACSRV